MKNPRIVHDAFRTFLEPFTGSTKEDREDRDLIWRMCFVAVMAELRDRSLRGIGGRTLRYKRAAGDEDLPQRFAPAWAALSDDEVMALYDALGRAKYPLVSEAH